MPLLVGLFLFAIVFGILREGYRRRGRQQGDTQPQSDRGFEAFKFFLTATIAIAGGIGYVRLFVWPNDGLSARKAMLLLGILGYIAASFTVVVVSSLLASKFERWHYGVAWRQAWCWVETWMMLTAYFVGSIVWAAAYVW
jgi:hypothetical protein